MKELPSSDLRFVSGGFNVGSATLHALGAVGSTVGYMLAIQIQRITGINVSGTVEGVTGANVISGFLSHSVWDDQNLRVDERIGSGLKTSLLCGAAVGLFEELAKTAISDAMQND
ncbi:hypothetical protein BOTU111921_01155 [Bordetella tumbae]|uniref:hypothetical protein n=1 Tax=Bordetella tumbae TaxID=1649139 RepID=UPI0039F0429F